MQALDETLTVAQRTELILTLLHGLCSRDHLSSDLASHLLLMVLESHGVEPGQVGTGRPAAEGSGRGDRDGHVRGCPGACVSTRPTPWGPWSPGRPRQWAAFPARGPGLRRAPGPCLVHNLVQGKRDAGPPWDSAALGLAPASPAPGPQGHGVPRGGQVQAVPAHVQACLCGVGTARGSGDTSARGEEASPAPLEVLPSGPVRPPTPCPHRCLRSCRACSRSCPASSSRTSCRPP